MNYGTYDKLDAPLFVAYKTGIDSGSITHHHNMHELVLFEHCDLRAFSQNIWCDVRDGDVALIPQFTLHHYTYADQRQYTRLVINFDAAFANQAGEALGFCELLPEPCVRQFHKITPPRAKFRHLMRLGHDLLSAHAAHAEAPSAQRMAAQSAQLFLLLSELRPLLTGDYASMQSASAPRYVKAALDFLNARYNTDFSLSDLSEALHIDKYYLCHLFKVHMGISIGKYVKSRRILEAQRMVLYTDRPLDVIASHCGFHSIQQFYKTFKDVTGSPPMAYRRRHRQMIAGAQKR